MSEESAVKAGDKVSFTFQRDKHLEGTVLERPSQHNFGCYVVRSREYQLPGRTIEPMVVHVRDWVTMTLGWPNDDSENSNGSD